MDKINMSMMADGVMLAVVGMTIVFVALIFLWLSLTLISKGINVKWKDLATKRNANPKGAEIDVSKLSGELTAAISTALHMYFQEIHDDERTILTIKRHTGRYSPWSSKIYTVMGLNKRFYKRSA